jgi:two-component system, NarL family, response regulator DegU
VDLEVCVEANDGEDAIQKALVWNPDLIILDTAMPVLDGFGAARKIKGLQPKVPILMLSVHGASEMVRHARSAGVQGFITKSEVGDVLLGAVEILLGGGTYFMNDEARSGHSHVRNLPAK